MDVEKKNTSSSFENKSRRVVEESKLPTVGMCFSGGGVRSAAFQTGVMKALSHFKKSSFR